MNDFLRHGSLRRRRPERKLPTALTEGAPPAKLAEHTTRCPTCGNWIIEGRDTIVFDYTTRTWVHDNGKCRANDTLHDKS